MNIKVKRIYEAADAKDGARILIDRRWPRGITKEKAVLAVWLKEIAPSEAICKAFDHQADRWDEFLRRYAAELRGNEAVDQVRAFARKGPVTLLYADKNTEQNNAVALAACLQKLT